MTTVTRAGPTTDADPFVRSAPTDPRHAQPVASLRMHMEDLQRLSIGSPGSVVQNLDPSAAPHSGARDEAFPHPHLNPTMEHAGALHARTTPPHAEDQGLGSWMDQGSEASSTPPAPSGGSPSTRQRSAGRGPGQGEGASPNGESSRSISEAAKSLLTVQNSPTKLEEDMDDQGDPDEYGSDSITVRHRL